MHGKPHPLRGVPRTAEVKAKISASKIGKPHTQKRSESAIAKLIAYNHTRKGKPLNYPVWNKGIQDEAYKTKMREKRLRQVFPQKDSSIEVRLQNGLNIVGHPYEKHALLPGQPDIFIQPTLCIFADGDYWHRRPEVKKRDVIINYELLSRGYTVLRFSEKEINADWRLCVATILTAAGVERPAPCVVV